MQLSTTLFSLLLCLGMAMALPVSKGVTLPTPDLSTMAKSAFAGADIQVRDTLSGRDVDTRRVDADEIVRNSWSE